jgi:hypothetical protein
VTVCRIRSRCCTPIRRLTREQIRFGRAAIRRGDVQHSVASAVRKGLRTQCSD